MSNAQPSSVQSPEVTIQRFCMRDIHEAALLLTASGLCTSPDVHARLNAFTSAHACAFSARRDNILVGVALGMYNGFHIFLSHLVVAKHIARKGVGFLLHEALVLEAHERNAIGVIADAWLSSAGWFHKRGYRTPGAVFLLKDLDNTAPSI